MLVLKSEDLILQLFATSTLSPMGSECKWQASRMWIFILMHVSDPVAKSACTTHVTDNTNGGCSKLTNTCTELFSTVLGGTHGILGQNACTIQCLAYVHTLKLFARARAKAKLSSEGCK